jgi:putative membrane protein insertion efficiency factor
MSHIAKLPIALIRGYQKWVSPSMIARCKYYPTCSSYALSAFQERGLLIGIGFTGWRLLRCNPWSKGGIDYFSERSREQGLIRGDI